MNLTHSLMQLKKYKYIYIYMYKKYKDKSTWLYKNLRIYEQTKCILFEKMK